MAVNGSAMTKAPTSAVDPRVGEAMEVYGRLDALRAAIAPDLNDAELQLFAMVSHRMGLDPFAREIHAVKRQGKVTFQVGIDGFRSKAEDTGEYVNQDEPVYGDFIDRPFPHPATATVTIRRRRGDEIVSQSATAYWEEFYPGESQGFQWKRMPRVMLAKCAEAMAFRKLFPRAFAGVYEPAEMDQAAAQDAKPVNQAPTARDRVAQQRAQVEARATTSAPEAAGAADGAITAVPVAHPAEAATAEPSLAPVPSGAGEGDADIVEGEAVEVRDAAPVQCDGFSDEMGRCRKAMAHSGLHRNPEGTWPQ